MAILDYAAEITALEGKIEQVKGEAMQLSMALSREDLAPSITTERQGAIVKQRDERLADLSQRLEALQGERRLHDSARLVFLRQPGGTPDTWEREWPEILVAHRRQATLEALGGAQAATRTVVPLGF
jgi:hypothetical protein